jgi:hypothetical protein
MFGGVPGFIASDTKDLQPGDHQESLVDESPTSYNNGEYEMAYIQLSYGRSRISKAIQGNSNNRFRASR